MFLSLRTIVRIIGAFLSFSFLSRAQPSAVPQCYVCPPDAGAIPLNAPVGYDPDTNEYQCYYFRDSDYVSAYCSYSCYDGTEDTDASASYCDTQASLGPCSGMNNACPAGTARGTGGGRRRRVASRPAPGNVPEVMKDRSRLAAWKRAERARAIRESEY